MRYLKGYKLFENKTFNKLDKTNYYKSGGQWYSREGNVAFSGAEAYRVIERDFGINYMEIGYILLDLVEDLNLNYMCSPSRGTNYNHPMSVHGDDNYFKIGFYPNISDNSVVSYKRYIANRLHIENDNGLYKRLNEYFEEINGRLSEYGLKLVNTGLLYSIGIDYFSIKIIMI